MPSKENEVMSQALILALQGLIVGLENLPLIIDALHRANYINAATKEQLFKDLKLRLKRAEGFLISWEDALEKAKRDIYGDPGQNEAG